jgi:uncharacterized protein
MDWMYEPWPWYVSGAIIGLVMVGLLYMGKTFGFSSNFRTLCAMSGAGSKISFFNYDWKKQTWNLLFLVGAVLGGYVTSQFFTKDSSVAISEQTVQDLQAMGLSNFDEIQPTDIFGWEFATSVGGVLFLLVGGFFIGFGSRYAGGCTSGHAITGISQLQVPSLIAVVGFFIGGLFMTFFVLPQVLPWLLSSVQ